MRDANRRKRLYVWWNCWETQCRTVRQQEHRRACQNRRVWPLRWREAKKLMASRVNGSSWIQDGFNTSRKWCLKGAAAAVWDALESDDEDNKYLCLPTTFWSTSVPSIDRIFWKSAAKEAPKGQHLLVTGKGGERTRPLQPTVQRLASGGSSYITQGRPWTKCLASIGYLDACTACLPCPPPWGGGGIIESFFEIKYFKLGRQGIGYPKQSLVLDSVSEKSQLTISLEG